MLNVRKNLYVNTCCDTPTKASIIKQISDTLRLGLIVEFIAIDGTKNETQPSVSNPTSSRQKIKVTFPNGKIIHHATVSDTFVEVVRYAGAANVRRLKINVVGDNLIMSKEHINPKYAISTKQVDDNWYCFTNINTVKKAEILKHISDSLSLNLIIDLD